MANETISPKDAKDYVISYNSLRKAVGILGMSFPAILYLARLILDGKWELLNSISSYYHSKAGNGFVGVLCAVALFMFSYLGHDKKDNILGHLAAIFALGVAFFPNNVPDPWTTINIIHLASAFFFFITLIVFSLWLFRKTDQEEMSDQKKNRNKVYLICGLCMSACILLIVLYKAWLIDIFPEHGAFQPVFWLESFALIAFGISWITKGQMIYKDLEDEVEEDNS